MSNSKLCVKPRVIRVEVKPLEISGSEIERRIRVNDHAYNLQFEYAENHISTSKYNIFTFVPKNLFEQFQRLANAYFLGLLLLQYIPAITSIDPVATIIPMTFVLGVSAVKEAWDDYVSHLRCLVKGT
ncbi:hypothetical protein BaRGS_00024217 [Batillaria attramentaria]|uniref:P-type ATPase N-terminal domain-containing protein n=1 Tax=Batillaria attramentaria TaxID=370345 RepID=A0ABD0KBV5_9CAEN